MGEEDLETPGADERVREIEDELRLATGLTALREHAGISQRELAERIGASQPRIAAIERSRNVTIDVLEQYVEALGANLEVSVVQGRRRTSLLGSPTRTGTEHPPASASHRQTGRLRFQPNRPPAGDGQRRAASAFLLEQARLADVASVDGRWLTGVPASPVRVHSGRQPAHPQSACAVADRSALTRSPCAQQEAASQQPSAPVYSPTSSSSSLPDAASRSRPRHGARIGSQWRPGGRRSSSARLAASASGNHGYPCQGDRGNQEDPDGRRSNDRCPGQRDSRQRHRALRSDQQRDERDQRGHRQDAEDTGSLLLTNETLLDQHRVVPADDVAHVDVATTGATATTTPVSTAATNTTRLHLRDAPIGSLTDTTAVSPTCRSQSNQPMVSGRGGNRTPRLSQGEVGRW